MELARATGLLAVVVASSQHQALAREFLGFMLSAALRNCPAANVSG